MSNVNDLNIPLSVITGDFNANSSKWWSLDKENAKGREINLKASENLEKVRESVH